MSELVVKDNALIQASYTLDLAEQRLILLAIIEARNSGQGITHDSLLKIHASSYAKQFGVNDKTAYTVVKDASKGLFDRYVTYHDKNPKNGKDRSFNCRWVDKIGVEPDSGIVDMRFTSDVVPLITRLESHFTSYEIDKVANLRASETVTEHTPPGDSKSNGTAERAMQSIEKQCRVLKLELEEQAGKFGVMHHIFPWLVRRTSSRSSRCTRTG